jgi:hypothetical protein
MVGGNVRVFSSKSKRKLTLVGPFYHAVAHQGSSKIHYQRAPLIFHDCEPPRTLPLAVIDAPQISLCFILWAASSSSAHV